MAGLLTGTYAHSLDAKGRVIIPANYRDKIGSKFTITISNSDKALVIYPAPKWQSIYEQLIQVSDMDEVALNYKRYLVSNAMADLDMDAQGRVLIPAALREAVGLVKDVTFVGMLDYAEIWDTATLVERTQKTRETFPEHLDHMNKTYGQKNS